MRKGIPSPAIHPISFLLGFLFFLFFFTQQCAPNKSVDDRSPLEQQHPNNLFQKQKGAHIFGRLDSTNIQPFLQQNIDWITLVPFGDQKDYDSPTMNYYRGDSLEMARRDSVWKSQIDLAHAYGFKIFLKPHIWIYETSDGKWRSDIFPNNEEDWERWKKSYREFILYYAKMAAKNKVELFCVGTELTRLTIEKPDFWKSLIQEVRSIYSGQITYAANWYEEFENITFWNDLDFIGIQAYFPLTNNMYPTVDQISKGWGKYLRTIESIHQKYKRKILFTELGYKSTPDSAIEPWQWIDYSNTEDSPVSLETQANCYEAFFNTVWEKDWFAGVHIWQMRSDFKKGRGKSSRDFTPQEKPAEEIIAKAFE